MEPEEHGDLKNLMTASDFFRCVPEDRVKMSDVGNLTGIGFDQPCESVGCLFGWLRCMPEIRDFAHKRHDKRVSVSDVIEWLGFHAERHSDDVTGVVRRPFPLTRYRFGKYDEGASHGLFTVKFDNGVSGKQEGLNRLDYLIAEARRSK